MMLDELGALLEDANLGTLGEDIYLNFMGEDPDTVIALYMTNSTSPREVFGAAGVYDALGLMVKVRAGARDFPAAEALARQVESVLRHVANQEVDGVLYYRITKNNGPSLTNYDNADRPVLSSNYSVWREDTSLDLEPVPDPDP